VEGNRKLRIALAALCLTGTAGAAALATSATGPAARANAAPARLPKVDLSRARHCDFIGQQKGSLCLLPFPDDYYTVRDRSTATGRRLNLATSAMPANGAGERIDAPPYNRNDGFSPGQLIVVKVAGLNSESALRETGAVPINHLGGYRKPNAPIVVIDAKTGKRWPIWAEIDSGASDPSRVALLIHPAKNFAAGHRYVVALRNLKTESGKTIPAPPGFRYYRDEIPSNKAPINRQRGRFESIFRTLRGAGIARGNLYLAWDFTVASDLNIAGRVLHMRDQAFRQLGDSDLSDRKVKGHAPAFSVAGVQNFTSVQDPNMAREVTGTFTVPCYLAPNCETGTDSRFQLKRGVPTRHGTYEANFDCMIPRAAIDSPGAAPARPSFYGHGLLGVAHEVTDPPQKTLGQHHDFMFCATNELGLSSPDIPHDVRVLTDLGKFPEVADRLQQGLLDELLLGRLMSNPGGFLTHPAFHVSGADTTSAPVFDSGHLYYDGNSQGGIMGGAFTAVSPDVTRSALGATGMTYSLLLTRSVDFDQYANLALYPSYPDQLTHPLALTLIQMLWDRGETNGYAHRMTTRPLPNTPPHKVLLNVAFGDHQVTTWAADNEARTIGAKAHTPVVFRGRWPNVDQLFGIPRIKSYPFRGSAIVYWDSGPTRTNPSPPPPQLGTDPPPLENVPDRSGKDPHSGPRLTVAEQQMVSDFLRPDSQSHITDTCSGGPCFDFTFGGVAARP
jgi:hypothetical protein